MPSGFLNAPATWQRLIDRVLRVDLEDNAMACLVDNILISKNIQKHLSLLTTVFNRLMAAGMMVSCKKVPFV